MKRQTILSLATSFVAAFGTMASAATTWNVPGNNSNVCTTVNPNCNTIQQAVTASTSGDTILIGAGTFSGTNNFNIVLSKSLTITGAGRTSTFVQPNAGSLGFSIRTNNITISDMTIQNGNVGVIFTNATSDNTHLTRIDFLANATRSVDVSTTAAFPVTNVTITDCKLNSPSAGIRMASNAQVNGFTISDSTFDGNQYGIYVANDGNTSKLSNLSISNSTFKNQISYGIYAEEMRDSTIQDSTFTSTGVGIGIFKFYSGNATAISNLTIQRNQFSKHRSAPLDIEIYAMALLNPIAISGNTFDMDVSLLTSNASAIFTYLSNSFATHAAINITNNTFTASGTFAGATATHGVRMRGNGPVVVTGNYFDGGNVGGAGTTPDSSALFIEANTGSMAATATFTASCNRISGFENGVSVFNSTAGVYGGLPVGATLTLTNNNIVGNSIVGVINGAAPPTVSAQNNWWGCIAGPGNAGCDAVTGGVDASSFATTPSTCAPCHSNAQCEDFNPCTVDACSMTCSNTAGNAGAICRAAVDVCDLAETCTGSSITCPTDSKGTSVCRPAAGACDLAESCDGIGNTCPADAKSTSVCRPSAGDCDVAESCDGFLDACPTDAFQSSTQVCRIAADICDAAENCTGSSAACPADAFQASTVICRASAGTCDPAENCSGSAAACPVDAKSTAVCRAAAGVCDIAESCDGVGNACPVDAKSIAVCRPAADVCDVSESCNGIADSCPVDDFKPSTQVCRAAAGVCDVAENCTGSGATCPADSFQPSTLVCRASAGGCDIAESCTGSGAACPGDNFKPSTQVCRAAASNCDIAESCTGSQAACPADALQPDGTICNVGNFCSVGVCQAPNSLVLSRARLNVNTLDTRTDGRAFARSLVNDNDTGGTLETQLVAGAVTIRIHDGGVFDVTRTLSSCKKYRTRVSCQSVDRKVKVNFAYRPGPYIYRMRVRFGGLGSAETGYTQPTGPVTVVLDQGNTKRDDVIGNLVPCWSHRPTRLTCRED